MSRVQQLIRKSIIRRKRAQPLLDLIHKLPYSSTALRLLKTKRHIHAIALRPYYQRILLFLVPIILRYSRLQ